MSDQRWSSDLAFSLNAVGAAVGLGAVGQALFALGVSVGIMIAYGAYMPAGESLSRGVGRGAAPAGR